MLQREHTDKAPCCRRGDLAESGVNRVLLSGGTQHPLGRVKVFRWERDWMAQRGE